MAKQNFSGWADEELLLKYRQGLGEIYVGELYGRYIPLVYGLCLKYLNNKEKAQDAVMDIYEVVTQKTVRHEIGNFKSWLYTVSKNHCLCCLKIEKREIKIEFEENIMENEPFFTLFDNEQSETEMEALTYCMQTLSEEQRRSVQYFYLENYSYVDIMEKTGYALSKVKSYIQNGKRNLKSCIINVLKKS